MVPFPPGNMSDLIARLTAEEMQTRHGVQVVVDNRAGATGAIGIQAVTRSEPDRYTLLLTSNSPVSVNPAVTLNRCRRLAKDWENLSRTALAFLRLASIRLMMRRLCQP
jgi:tripartite-type tricarboxylate transporter receptor subunit TctC